MCELDGHYRRQQDLLEVSPRQSYLHAENLANRSDRSTGPIAGNTGNPAPLSPHTIKIRVVFGQESLELSLHTNIVKSRGTTM